MPDSDDGLESDAMNVSTLRRSRLGRRALLGGVVMAGAAAAGVRELLPGGEASSAQQRGVEQSDLLVDSIGVNTHLTWRSTGYLDADRVLASLQDMGIRHVRDRIVPSGQLRAVLNRFAAEGVRVQGICGALGDPQTMDQVMAEVKAGYRRPLEVFTAFEGINEPNNDGVPWVTETREKTAELFSARGRAGLSSVPIVAPSLARVNDAGVEGSSTPEQADSLGDLSDLVDLGNVHVYPRQQTPSADIDRFIAYQRSVSGKSPVVCSEAGYFTAMNYRGGAWPTPESVVSSYLPRLVLEHWIRRTRRVFLYELLDRYDPGNSDRLSAFGLLGIPSAEPSASWREKPAYGALKNLITLLADPGRAHRPAKLDLEIEGGKELRSARFAKRDGSHYLALWRDVSCYDAANRRSISVAEKDVRVKLGRRCAVSVFEPTTSAEARDQSARTRDLRLSVGHDLVIARFA